MSYVIQLFKTWSKQASYMSVYVCVCVFVCACVCA